MQLFTTNDKERLEARNPSAHSLLVHLISRHSARLDTLGYMVEDDSHQVLAISSSWSALVKGDSTRIATRPGEQSSTLLYALAHATRAPQSTLLAIAANRDVISLEMTDGRRLQLTRHESTTESGELRAWGLHASQASQVASPHLERHSSAPVAGAAVMKPIPRRPRHRARRQAEADPNPTHFGVR